MRLDEIFADAPDDGLGVTGQLRQALLDLLTPMTANGVPFVTVQQVMDELWDHRSGLHIDRALIMNLLNPAQVRIVKKIEGDRIYITTPTPDQRDVSADEKEREQERLEDKATKQAKKNIKAR
jgi:hypothetical protein